MTGFIKVTIGKGTNHSSNSQSGWNDWTPSISRNVIKSLLNAIVFTEVAKSHLTSPIFPISFSLYHSPPPKVSFVDQFFLLAYRAFSWFFYLRKDYISKDLHLSSRVNPQCLIIL